MVTIPVIRPGASLSSLRNKKGPAQGRAGTMLQRTCVRD